MFNLNFYLRNPLIELYKHMWVKSGQTPFKNKAWEIELFRSSDIIGFTISFDVAQDHAGLRTSISLLTWNLDFSIYDTRHWDYDSDDWATT